jgi:molecular chaperone DnaK (HSP70)
LEPVERVLFDAKISKAQIDDIVLVGGSTRIPKIQELLQEYFNGKVQTLFSSQNKTKQKQIVFSTHNHSNIIHNSLHIHIQSTNNLQVTINKNKTHNLQRINLYLTQTNNDITKVGNGE